MRFEFPGLAADDERQIYTLPIGAKRSVRGIFEDIKGADLAGDVPVRVSLDENPSPGVYPEKIVFGEPLDLAGKIAVMNAALASEPRTD